jgi:hypothetical protein
VQENLSKEIGTGTNMKIKKWVIEDELTGNQYIRITWQKTLQKNFENLKGVDK